MRRQAGEAGGGGQVTASAVPGSSSQVPRCQEPGTSPGTSSRFQMSSQQPGAQVSLVSYCLGLSLPLSLLGSGSLSLSLSSPLLPKSLLSPTTLSCLLLGFSCSLLGLSSRLLPSLLSSRLLPHPLHSYFVFIKSARFYNNKPTPPRRNPSTKPQPPQRILRRHRNLYPILRDGTQNTPISQRTNQRTRR